MTRRTESSENMDEDWQNIHSVGKETLGQTIKKNRCA